MPIKKSLRIILILFSVVPASILCFLTYFYVEESLVKSREKDLTYLASYASSQISQIINAQIYEQNLHSTRWLFEDPNTASLPQSEVSQDEEQGHRRAVQTYLSTMLLKYPYLSSLGLYDAGGNLITHAGISSSNENDASLIIGRHAIQTPRIHFSSSKMGNTYLIHIIKPILTTKKELLGYLRSSIRIPYFDYLFDYSFGDTQSILLLDPTGRILYSNTPEEINSYVNDACLALLTKEPRTIEAASALHCRDKNNLYAYSRILGTTFSILIKQDTYDVTHGATVIFYTLLGCFFILVLIILLGSSYYARYYTAPIFKLRDAMKQVSDGKLSSRCLLHCKNEIGELSESFNKMIDILQSNYNDLNTMHHQLIDNEEVIRTNYNRIEYLAYHDVLTNLPNKLSFLEKLEHLLLKNQSNPLLHAIYFIDLDNFKTINDTLGHDYGDAVLSEIGSILSSFISPQDMVSRVGGDEFLIFRYGILTQEDAAAFAHRLLQSFETPFQISNETLHISLSIGIAIYPMHGTNQATLIKHADIAMYHSKESGKNRITIYQEHMSEKLHRNTEILDILRTVIEQQEVYLLYQPQLDSLTKRVVGYEALMRIHSKRLGALSPCEFIPIAEESGMITSLGLWALKEACTFNASLLKKGLPVEPVSVNISSLQLKRSDFVEQVQQILQETKLPPAYLKLEITESALISSLDDTFHVLKQFEVMGIDILLDDFGTGYSSLKYLTSLPISALKIDKSFINNLCVNEKDHLIAKSIISLAHSIDMNVIAEGVETKEQYERLKEEGCNIMQGFLFSPPITQDELRKLLSTQTI